MKHSYWTFTVRNINNNISWKNFRKKFKEFGGTGIFASWKLLYQEDVFKNGNWKKRCDHYKNYGDIMFVKTQKKFKNNFFFSFH